MGAPARHQWRNALRRADHDKQSWIFFQINAEVLDPDFWRAQNDELSKATMSDKAAGLAVGAFDLVPPTTLSSS